MAKDNLKLKQSKKQHHYLRSFLSLALGFLAVNLIILGILAWWLSSTLTNTDKFVSAVAPLSENSDIQKFVAKEVGRNILDAAEVPVRDFAGQLLPNENLATQSEQQIRSTIEPIIEESVQKVVQSPVFGQLWKQGITAAHSGFVSQLENNNQKSEINLKPVAEGIINELSATRLAFIKDKLDLEKFELKIDLSKTLENGNKNTGQIDQIRSYYEMSKSAILIIFALAVGLAILSITIASHHLKTFRRIAILTGVFTIILALALQASSSGIGSLDDVQQKAIAATLNTITQPLRNVLLLIGGVSLAAGVATKLYELKFKK